MVAAPVDLRFEHHTDAGPVLGVGTGAPRLSWVVPEADPAFAQDAYEVELERPGRETELIRVMGAEQVLVPWPSVPLSSREPARVRVRVTGSGLESPWSEPATIEAGLLEAADWTARFVSPSELGRIGAPAPVVGAVLDVPDRVVRAPCTQPRTASTARPSMAGASATTSWRPAGRATRTGCATRPTTSPSSSARARGSR